MKRLNLLSGAAAACAALLLFQPGAHAQGDDDGGNIDDLPGLGDGDGAAADDNKTAVDGSVDLTDVGASGAPASGGKTKLTLPKGQLYVETFLEVNLSNNAAGDAFAQAFEPVAIHPDAWYGIDDKLTVGLGHSPRATTGFLTNVAPGGGLCLQGDGGNCFTGPYSSTGILARYHVLDSPVIVAADGGILIFDYSPFTMALKLGAVGEWQLDKIHVLFGLNLLVGITKRTVMDTANNREVLNIPISAMYDLEQFVPKLMAGVHTGFRIPFTELADSYTIPFGVGARYIVTPQIIVDGSLTFPFLLGGTLNGGAARVLTLGGGYVF